MPDGADPEPTRQLSPAQLNALAELDPETIRALDQPHTTRRDMLKGGALGAALGLGVGGGAQSAMAAPQPSGGEGDFGSPSSPFEGWADGLAQVTETVTSSTTVTKHVVPFDSSVSGFTLTIGSDLEGSSGFSTRVVFIDETGNASTNPVTVEAAGSTTIDGGSSVTLDSDGARTVFRWDGSEWVTKTFTPSVDAGAVTTEGLHTKSRYADAVVWQDSDGTWHADGSDGEIDSGSSADTVLQSAVDDADTKTVLAAGLDPSSVSITVTGDEVVQYLYSDTAAGGLGNLWHEGSSGAGINFWGSGENGDYQSINWFPEQRGTTDTDTDVRITAHKTADDGSIHQHLSIYTSKADGTPHKRLDIPYGSDTVKPHWQNISSMAFGGPIEVRQSNEGAVAGSGDIRLSDQITIAALDAEGGGMNLIQTFSDDKLRLGGTENAGIQIRTSGTIELDSDVNINPSSTYTLSNVTTDRTLDADSTSTAELADVISTVIQDLGMDA